MRIDAIQLVRLPLENVRSEQGAARESVLVGMFAGEHCGWGEATLGRGPLDCDEWSAGAFACLRDWIAPSIVGRDIHAARDLQAVLDTFQGHARAKSAVDTAWWNLLASSQGKPLWEVLGGTRGVAPAGVILGVMESGEQLIAAIGSAFEARCEQVTLKFRPGWSVEMLRGVRQAFAAESLAIDCDGLCAVAQLEAFYRLDDFFLTAIEQPFAADDLVAQAMLQQAIRTPIMLDQSVTSLARAEQAIDLGSCRQMRLDPARLGGLTTALAVREACVAAGIGWTVGGVAAGPLAARAALSLAMLPGRLGPTDARLLPGEPWAVEAGAGWTAQTAEGKLGYAPPDGTAGVGVEVERAMLLGRAVEQAEIR